jgi:hypothetical protein
LRTGIVESHHEPQNSVLYLISGVSNPIHYRPLLSLFIDLVLLSLESLHL